MRRALDAGNRRQASRGAASKSSRGFAVIVACSERKRHRRDRAAYRIPLDAREVPERPQHEPGAREQDQRERELTDDRAPAAVAARPAGRRRGRRRADQSVQVALPTCASGASPNNRPVARPVADREQQHGPVDAGVERERDRDGARGGDRAPTRPFATSTPSPAPSTDRSSPSIANARRAAADRRRARCGLAISRCRASARVSSRLATFTHAISNRKETAPNSMRSAGRTSRTTSSRNLYATTLCARSDRDNGPRPRFRRCATSVVELRLRLRQRHARLQPTEHLDAVIV